jgi:CBS domain-containing protein
MTCPSCGNDNFAGTDQCDHCGYSLTQEDVQPKLKTKLQEVLMTHPIQKILRRKKVGRLSPNQTIKDALRLLTEEGHGCVLVEDGGSLVGILSERDILYKVSGKGMDPDQIKVSEVMTPNPVTLEGDATVAFALNKMSVGGFRHIPLVSNGNTLGVISVKDVLKFLSESI